MTYGSCNSPSSGWSRRSLAAYRGLMSAFDLFCIVRDKAYRVFHDYSVYSVEMFSGLTGDFVLRYQHGLVIHSSRAFTSQGKAWWQRDFGVHNTSCSLNKGSVSGDWDPDVLVFFALVLRPLEPLGLSSCLAPTQPLSTHSFFS